MTHALQVPLSAFDQNRHLAYPHNNGFCDGGASLVLAELQPRCRRIVKRRLSSGAEEIVAELPWEADGSPAPLWFDVSDSANRLVYANGDAIYRLDLSGGKEPEAVFESLTGEIEQSVNIRADGNALLVVRKVGDVREILEIDVESGTARTVLARDWWVGHAHYCPFDPAWIGFCHEGPTETIPDRVWAWHAVHAPEGRCLFVPAWDVPDKRLYAGHERWNNYAASSLVVAYGVSPGTPRGIYETGPGLDAPRLVSEGNRDWHVSSSGDGRWIAVDTTGPTSEPGMGWTNARNRSDIVLIDAATGARTVVATTLHAAHPSHPHPCFAPDGKTLFYNETDETLTRNRVMALDVSAFVG